MWENGLAARFGVVGGLSDSPDVCSSTASPYASYADAAALPKSRLGSLAMAEALSPRRVWV